MQYIDVSDVVEKYIQIPKTICPTIYYVCQYAAFYQSQNDIIRPYVIRACALYDGKNVYVRKCHRWIMVDCMEKEKEFLEITYQQTLTIATIPCYYVSYTSNNITIEEQKEDEIVFNIQNLLSKGKIEILEYKDCTLTKRVIKLERAATMCTNIRYYGIYTNEWKTEIQNGFEMTNGVLTCKTTGWFRFQFQITLKLKENVRTILPTKENIIVKCLHNDKEYTYAISKSLGNYIQVNIENANIGTNSGQFILNCSTGDTISITIENIPNGIEIEMIYLNIF